MDGAKLALHVAASRAVQLPVKLPLVSVVITNFNYAEYVCAAIASVRDQSYAHFECCVVDDRSTDGSWAVIEDFLAEMDDSRFRAIRLERNSGQMGAMKAGLETAKGEFVSFLDADDFWLPDFISTHVSVHLNSHHSAGLTASDTVQINREGAATEGTYFLLKKTRSGNPADPVKRLDPKAIPRIVGDRIRPAVADEIEVTHVDRFHWGWHGVATSAFMFRRDALVLVMPRDTSRHRICADYYLVMFIHALSGTLTISKAFSAYRLHDRNRWGNNPRIGGPNPLGYFPEEEHGRAKREISRVICANEEVFSRVIGIHTCEQIVRSFCEPHQFYACVRLAPQLRRRFGRGAAWRFYLDYGVKLRLKRLFKRR